MSKQNGLVKVVEMHVVDFEVVDLDATPTHRHVVIVYARGEDGIIYELAGGTWARFPIQPDRVVDVADPLRKQKV